MTKIYFIIMTLTTKFIYYKYNQINSLQPILLKLTLLCLYLIQIETLYLFNLNASHVKK